MAWQKRDFKIKLNYELKEMGNLFPRQISWKESVIPAGFLFMKQDCRQKTSIPSVLFCEEGEEGRRVIALRDELKLQMSQVVCLPPSDDFVK